MSEHHKHEKVFDVKRAAVLDSPERKERIPHAAIILAARLSQGIRVADIGSGTGYYLFALLNSNTPPARIEAIDASEGMNSLLNEKLKSHALRDRVHLHKAYAEHLPLPDKSVDLAIMGNVFHEFDDPKMALAEARRILATNGRILIIDWSVPQDTSKEPEEGPSYDHRVSEAHVLSALKFAGFRDIEVHEGFKNTYALSGKKGEPI